MLKCVLQVKSVSPYLIELPPSEVRFLNGLNKHRRTSSTHSRHTSCLIPGRCPVGCAVAVMDPSVCLELCQLPSHCGPFSSTASITCTASLHHHYFSSSTKRGLSERLSVSYGTYIYSICYIAYTWLEHTHVHTQTHLHSSLPH